MTRRALALAVAAAVALAAPAEAADPSKQHKPLVRAAPYVTLVNDDFESPRRGLHGNPEGWSSIQHAGDLSYTFKLDRDVRHGGAASLRIDNVGPEPFGSTYQQVDATRLRGQRLRWSGWLRTEGVRGSATGGGAVLLMQAMQAGAPLAWNHMTDAPIRGTTDWQRVSIELDVPAAAETVEVGVMLHGPGRLWLDDVELEAVPRG
jgi:hypothetical protein